MCRMKAFIHFFTVFLQIFYSFNCFAVNDFDFYKQSSQCLAPASFFKTFTGASATIGKTADFKSIKELPVEQKRELMTFINSFNGVTGVDFTKAGPQAVFNSSDRSLTFYPLSFSEWRIDAIQNRLQCSRLEASKIYAESIFAHENFHRDCFNDGTRNKLKEQLSNIKSSRNQVVQDMFKIIRSRMKNNGETESGQYFFEEVFAHYIDTAKLVTSGFIPNNILGMEDMLFVSSVNMFLKYAVKERLLDSSIVNEVVSLAGTADMIQDSMRIDPQDMVSFMIKLGKGKARTAEDQTFLNDFAGTETAKNIMTYFRNYLAQRAGASHSIGLADKNINFNGEYDSFTSDETQKINSALENIKKLDVRSKLEKMGIKSSEIVETILTQLNKALDPANTDFQLILKKSKNGIQGAEAVFEATKNAKGMSIQVVLDSGFGESTIFHELMESILMNVFSNLSLANASKNEELRNELVKLAHSYTFALETELYQSEDSILRKLNKYDSVHLRNIVLNTQTEVANIEASRISKELKAEKIENAYNIEKKALELLAKDQTFSVDAIARRLDEIKKTHKISFAEGLYNIGQNNEESLRTRLMISYLLDSMNISSNFAKSFNKSWNSNYVNRGQGNYFFGEQGLTLDDLKNYNVTIVSENRAERSADIYRYAEDGNNYAMVNGNPYIWCSEKEKKVILIANLQEFTWNETPKMEEIQTDTEQAKDKQSQNNQNSEEAKKEATKRKIQDLKKLLTFEYTEMDHGEILHVNSQKNSGKSEDYVKVYELLDLSNISTDSWNTFMKILSDKIENIKQPSLRKELKKRVNDYIAASIKLSQANLAGASKTIGIPTVSSNAKNLAPVTDSVFSSVIQFNGTTTMDDNVLPGRIKDQQSRNDKKIAYAVKANALLKMLKSNAADIAQSFADRKIISSSQTSAVAASIFAQLTNAVIDGNQCNLNAPVLLNSYVEYSTDVFTNQQKPSLVLQIGDTKSVQNLQETEWQAPIIKLLFSEMTGTNLETLAAKSSVNTNMFMLLSANAAMKKALGSIEGQEIRRTNDFVFADIFDMNSNPLNDTTGSLQFAA